MVCALPPLAPSQNAGGRCANASNDKPLRALPYREITTNRRGRAASCDAVARIRARERGRSPCLEQRHQEDPPVPRRRAAASLERARQSAPEGSPVASGDEVLKRRSSSQQRVIKSSQERHSNADPETRNVSSVAEEGGNATLQDTSCRYVVQFGNNSALIRQLMRNRPGWNPAPGDPGSSSGSASFQDKRVTKLRPSAAGVVPEINLLWTQYKSSAFLGAMAKRQTRIVVLANEEKTIKLKALPSSKSCSPANGPRLVPPRIHNHFEGSGWLCTKRGICDSMTAFYLGLRRDPFGAIPLTFIIREGTSDPQFALFRLAYDDFKSKAKHCMWLVKPGEWGNRGCGIRIYNDAEEVAQRVDSKEKVWVIQKYMEKPFLVHKRKFDIRAYCLVVQEPAGGPLRAFCYRDAYLRTTSAKYTTKRFDRMIHLNNDAVQKNGEDYGKFESANKMSLDEFQKYLDEHRPKDRLLVREHLMRQIRGLMADAVRATSTRLNPRGIDHCFEIYGFDFMVDANFRVWLIECNANPCLDLCSSYLSHLIPTMLDQALRLSLDRLFPAGRPSKVETQDYGGEGGTKWDLIFESSREPHDRDLNDELSATWVEPLPHHSHTADASGNATDAPALAALALGRQIMCSKERDSNRTAQVHKEQEVNEYSDEEAEECDQEEQYKDDDEASEEEGPDDDDAI